MEDAPDMTLRLVLLGLNILVFVGIVLLYRRVKQTQPSQGIEAFGSTTGVADGDDLRAKEIWERLDLEKMHRVNREEVERVLAKLHETSVRGLTPSERAFLDRMVEVERRSEA